MGEIVNLKRHRKRKDRAAKEEIAAENRVQFGRTKAERDAAAADAERRARMLDGAKLED